MSRYILLYFLLFSLSSCSNTKEAKLEDKVLPINFFTREYTENYKESPKFRGGPFSAQGILVFENKCFYIQTSDNFVGEKNITHKYQLVWPWNYKHKQDANRISIIDGKGKKVIVVGDKVKLTGGLAYNTKSKLTQKCQKKGTSFSTLTVISFKVIESH